MDIKNTEQITDQSQVIIDFCSQSLDTLQEIKAELLTAKQIIKEMKA